MKRFSARYQTLNGIEESTFLAADTQEDATQELENKGFIVLEVTELSGAAAGSTQSAGQFVINLGVPLAELFHFTRLFGTMVKAGFPLLEALEILRDRSTHVVLQNTLTAIHAHIQSGGNLAEAFSRHPDVFDFTYQSMIKVGEESGELEKTIERLVVLIDKRIKLRRAIRKAITYPLLVVCISILVTYAILTWIVPKFKEIFNRFGSELPYATQVTVACSDFLIHHTHWLIIGIVVGMGILSLIRRTRLGKNGLDRFQLWLPLFGPMYHTFEIAQFAKSFSILLHSGVTVITGLEILTPTVTKEPIKEALVEVREAIQSGQNMSNSFSAQEPWFPDLFNKMMTVGERSGNLTQMLDHIAEFYEEEFHNKVDTLASLIEPILIVFLGVVIGGIVISLYLPIFSLAKLISKR